MSSSWLFFALACLLAMHAESKDCTSTGTQVHVYFQQSGVILPDEAKDSLRDAVAKEMGMATTDFHYEVTSNKVVLIFAGAEAVEKAAALQDKVENQYKGAWNPVEGFPVGMVKIEEQYSCKDAVVGTISHISPKKFSAPVKGTSAPYSPIEIEEPTANPTELVTRAPTDEPTAEPTSEPTELMTAFPTQVTPAPSELPTRDPTSTPTELPSAEPSHTPSYEPTTLDPTTVEPTAEPTAEPTYHPSHTPTEVPTTKPPTTDDPSFAPTHTPTEEPTLSPTHTPTFEPTEAPTTLPPTEYPTTPPTESPTENPTSEPSAGPTESPTELPTHAPTRDPTEVPTTKPPTTDSPSEAPTHTPTKDPTEVPTHTPTEVPTPSPTVTPTEVPTPAPTTYPTREPTTEDPTLYPTSVPTTKPPTTDEPSFSPTHTPTYIPTTADPTPQPTSVPTAYPSWAKTTTPTETPSVAPTAAGTAWAGTLAPTMRPTFAPVEQETCPSLPGCPQDCSCKGTCTQNVLVSYVDSCFATYQTCTSIAATCETNMRNCLAAGALAGFTCACNAGYAGTACQLPAPTCNGLICGGGTGTSFGVSTVNGVETGMCKCGTGYTLDPVSKCCKLDTIVVSTATCSSSASPTAAPGIAKSTCLNGGVYENGACTCFGAWNGPNCQYPGLPVGWEIEPPSACNGLPLVSTDMPLQSTWVRMMTAQEDNVVTFKPWKESKLEILKDIVIGLDQPYVLAGSDLQSGPAGAGDTLTGSGVISAWIGFANTSFVVRASILAQMSIGASSYDAYGASAGRRLLSKARAHLRDDERAAMEAYDMAHSYGGAAGASMAMAAFAIRIDMPLGLSIGTIDKRYCEYEAYLPRLSNVALYFSTGDLSDKQLALLPGGGLGGLQVKQGITIMAEYYINGCALPGLTNIVRDATTLFMATVALPPQFGITLTSQTALRFSEGSPIIGGAASLTFSVVGSLMEEEAQALLQVGCPGIKSYVETKGKIAVWLGRDANGNAAQVEFQATTYIGTQTCPVLAAPMRIQGDMIGCWNNPLGIKGFSLCDVGLGIGVDATRLAAGPAAFDYFRVQAGLVIGSTKWAIKVVVDVSTPANSAILGALNGTVCLSDIFNFPLVLARNAGLDVPLIPAYFVPKACMADIVLKASLSKIVIAGDTYDAGIQMSGKITLLSTTFSFLFRIAFIELRIMATATKIQFGPLTIGGLGCDMIANTADDGPCLDAMFKASPSPFTAYFKFTGLFSVTSFFSVSTDLLLDQNGLMLKFSTTLVIATADFEIATTQKGDDSSKGQIVDFAVKFEYTNAGWAYLGNMMLDGLKQWEADINAAIAKANNDLAAAAVRAGDECRNALGVNAEEATAYVQLETLSKVQREEIISQRIMGSIHRIAVAAGYKHCPKTNGTQDENCVDVTHIHFEKLAELIKIAEEKGHFAKEVAMPKAPTAPKMDAKQAFAPLKSSRRLLAKVEADELSDVTIPETNGAAVNALQTGAKTKWHVHHRHHNHHWHHSHHSHHWHHSHHSHHLHIPHNHHWHHRHHRHHFHLAAIVSSVVSGVKAVWNAVAGALCNLGQAFMDSVVRATVVGIMEIGKTVVLAAGKVVAMGLLTIGAAMDKVFSVQRIYYAGSLAAAAKGNFGTLEIDLTVFATKINLKVVFDIVGMIKALGTAVKDAVAQAVAIFK